MAAAKQAVAQQSAVAALQTTVLSVEDTVAVEAVETAEQCLRIDKASTITMF